MAASLSMPFQIDAKQAQVIVNGELDVARLDERHEKAFEPGFAMNYVVPFPNLPAPMGSDPHHTVNALTAELAFVEANGEPNGQQEPLFVTSFTGEPVSRDVLREFRGADDMERARNALRKKYMPFGFVNHDVYVADSGQVQDRPGLVVGGIVGGVRHYGPDDLHFGDVVVGEPPETVREATDQRSSFAKAVGILKPLHPRAMQPQPADHALALGVHSPAAAKGGLREPEREEDPANALRDFAQLCFMLGAMYGRDRPFNALTPAQLAGVDPLPPGAAANVANRAGGANPRELGAWENTPLPALLMRAALGMQPEEIEANPEWAGLSAAARNLMLNAAPRLCASGAENLRDLARRVVGFVTRPGQGSRDGEASTVTIMARYGM